MRATASRTAILVCQGRAAADGRVSDDRFSDPVARQVLREEERRVVDQVRAGTPPKGIAARLDYEFVRGCGAVVVPRTVAIDDALRQRPAEQVVILGAGLDTRAWRMDELARAVVFEVDHPVTQLEKRARLGTRSACAREVRFVATDFAADELDQELGAAGHHTGVRTTWVWEGVISYLTAAEVAATLAVIERRSAPGSALVINYQVRSARTGAGRLLARVMLRAAGRPDPWQEEPHRSTWTPNGLGPLLHRHGFDTLRDHDLLHFSAETGAARADDRVRVSLRSGHVLVAERR